MKWVVALSLFLGFGVQADPNPTYLSQVKGLVLKSLTETDDFSFEPGTLSNCVRKTVSDWVIYDCDVAGASATVSSTRRSRTFHFTTAKIWFRYHKSVGFFSEYHLSGKWQEKGQSVNLDSDVLLTLWHPRAAPQNLKGSLTLKSYNMSMAIQATQ